MPMEYRNVPIRVEMIEFNHKFSDRGQYSYSQFIFRNRSESGKYRVHGWKLFDQKVLSDPEYFSGAYHIYIELNGRVVEVQSPICRNTYTHHDPEMTERGYWDGIPPDILLDSLKKPKVDE